jgi:hypothetical protein
MNDRYAADRMGLLKGVASSIALGTGFAFILIAVMAARSALLSDRMKAHAVGAYAMAFCSARQKGLTVDNAISEALEVSMKVYLLLPMDTARRTQALQLSRDLCPSLLRDAQTPQQQNRPGLTSA